MKTQQGYIIAFLILDGPVILTVSACCLQSAVLGTITAIILFLYYFYYLYICCLTIKWIIFGNEKDTNKKSTNGNNGSSLESGTTK